MKAYIIIENNGEEYDEYNEWISTVCLDKDKAIKTFDELVINSKWQPPKKQRKFSKYYENGNNGFYRLEEHDIIE